MDSVYAELTSREKEILKLIAKNATNTEIASKLHISIKTVVNYATLIFSKLQVADRKEAEELARRWKMDTEMFSGG
ncbi:response regulator transcription factor [Cohnella luojiensis]|uniref:response regulator transcription factor n=1 Tax=Cohnella luojiensis TaxID=652876 RepID=UPI001F1187B5|nr:LuxR C-terminal-related transcriptional regulator [Cohnella luojiensis]